MPEISPQELLHAAAQYIETALIKLNMRQSACAECGHRQYQNRAHAKVYEALTDMPDRLRRAAARLDEDLLKPAPLVRAPRKDNNDATF